MHAPRSKIKTRNARVQRQAGAAEKKSTGGRRSNTSSQLLAAGYASGPVLSLSRLQAKISVGKANDAFEREADNVADHVVSGQQAPAITPVPASGLGGAAQMMQMAAAPGEQSLMQTLPLQRQPEEESEEQVEPVQAELLQRQQEEDDEEEAVQTKLLQRQAEKESEEETVQTKLLQRQPEEEGVEEAGPVQGKLLQRQAEESEEESVQTKLLQRQPEEEGEEEAGPVQSKLLQRQAEEESEEEVQAKLLQRQPEEEGEEEAVQTFAIQRLQSSDQDNLVEQTGSGGQRFASSLAMSGNSGEPLNASTRSIMESRFNVDFSNIRVHYDQQSVDMSDTIAARAFTFGNHIYFNRGEYSPGTPAGQHLLAHELTHTVQQGAARGKAHHSPAANVQSQRRVQRSWLGDAWGAVSGAVSSAVEWVGDSINAAVDYIKDQAQDFLRAIPGYSLLSVVLGEDPITHAVVPRNGRNFIEAGLDVIPNGAALKQKLEQEGALAEAAQWLDEQIAILDFSPTEIASQLRRFWSRLRIEDVARLREVLQELAGIFSAPIQRLVRFAVTVAERLLQIIKDYVIDSLISFIRERTTAYPLLTVILGRDPISDEPVERTPMALLRGFMQLSESGAEQLRQMEESGSLQRAADWLNGAIERLDISWETIRNMFSSAWDRVTIQSLLDPIGTFRDLYNIFAGPVGRIIHFLIEIAVKVLGFIKDALISRLVEYARTVRGYPLLTVILGKDPFSQEPVERNAGNIVHGFMSLMENGEQQYQEMEQSGAIARLNTRVENAIATLNFTWDYIRGLFTRAWNRFSLQDLAAPIQAFQNLLAIFGQPLLRLINFVVEIIKIVIEVVMEIMNFPIDLINNIINRAMQAIDDIKRDPIGFLKNLIRAVKTGFQQFFDNILQHLLNGLTGWLMSEMRDANVNPPADWTFRSVLAWVLEIFGITVEAIWEKLAERIGRERVQRIRGMIDRLVGIWTFVRDVMTRGPVAIWEYIQERLSNLWDTILEAIRNWVVTRIVERVVARLITMLDPTGIMTVINGFIAFYNAVQSFIRYVREMLEIVNSFVVGVAELARGNVTIAANFLENALDQGMPVAIGFLANQVGLSGIGRRIGEMIENVRGMVDEGLTWLVDRAVSAGTSFLNSVRGALGLGGGAAEAEPEEGAGGDGDWRDEEGTFQEDGVRHEVTYDGSTIKIASDNPTSIQQLLHLRESEDPDYPDDKRQIVTNVINTKIPELNTLKNQHQTAQMNNDSAAMSSAEDAIAAKLQEIANLLESADLFMGAGGINTPPVYGPEHAGLYGSLARVDRLSSNGLVIGTEANSNLFNDNYRAVNERWQGQRRYYVRGHLLSWHLGGPGNDWKNLTPLFQNVNAAHEANFESDVKTAVEGGLQVSNFSVRAIYGRSLSPHVSILRNPNNDTIPGGMDPEFDPVKVAELLEAEVMVPQSLQCHAEISDGRTLNVPITNNINYGMLSDYDLAVPMRNNFNLTNVVNGAADRNGALGSLMSLHGVDNAIATRIYDRIKGGQAITNFYQQIGISKKELQRLNPDKWIQQ